MGQLIPKKHINQIAEKIFKNSISIFRDIWEKYCFYEIRTGCYEKESENKKDTLGIKIHGSEIKKFKEVEYKMLEVS